MSPNPGTYDRAAEQLEQDYADGLISQEEFRREMRLLNEDFRESAREAAEEAYRDMTGDW